MNGGEQPPGPASTPIPGSSVPDPALELYKLEYERAAIRYEDIYKALWQIFSYLSAVTGALLAFGGDRFQETLLWFLVSIPLLFWFCGTYWPLNKYGDLCLARLAQIEEKLRGLSQADVRHYTDFKQRPSEGLRARHVIWILSGLLHVIFFWNLYGAISAWHAGTSLLGERPTEVKIITVSPTELEKLLKKPPRAAEQPSQATPPKKDKATQN